jgi:hypothetical protein
MKPLNMPLSTVGCAPGAPGRVGVASDQAVELFGVDLVAGEPELHFDLVMAQLPRYALVAARQRQRLAQQALQPLAEGGDPAGPVTAVAALANGALDQLGCR